MLRVEAFGNVGADPELHTLENGNRWCKLSVASSRKIKNERKTTWFEFRFWNYSCDFVMKYVRKGDKVAIYNAELTAYKYTAEDGTEKTLWHGTNGQIEIMPQRKTQEAEQTPYEQFENEEWF